ncbi:MAG TPA: ATP-binding protein [Bacteroidia bacterium]|nr:ATP-binding protein [Bacteroidia bacterium]
MLIPISPGKQTKGPAIPHPDEDTIWLVLDSNEDGLSQLNRFSLFISNYWKIDEAVHQQIHIALTEAVMNAMIHGNKNNPDLPVYLSAGCNEECLSFTIEDRGAGFDHRRFSDPTADADYFHTHGHGVSLMLALADVVHYSFGGRKLQLVFYREKIKAVG